MEFLIIIVLVLYEKVKVIVDFKNMGDWVIFFFLFEGEEFGHLYEDSTGIAALSGYGN